MPQLSFSMRVQDKLARRARRELGRLKRWVAPPSWPVRADGRRLLHLGCGGIDAPGFVNVDALNAPHIHIRGPLDDLGVFADATVDLVYASHCLEHFSYFHTPAVLREWVRVLKPGGILRVAVPDFGALADLYRRGAPLRELEGFLYGGQDYRYNFHQVAFDELHLRELLSRVGLSDVRRWDPEAIEDHSFRDDSSARYTFNGQAELISLNLQGRR
jgi:SAM-dependent methyltransferase